VTWRSWRPWRLTERNDLRVAWTRKEQYHVRMGTFRATTSFLSLTPAVWGDDDHLYCRTSLFQQMVSLFAYRRLVVVDRMRRTVRVSARTWWMASPDVEVPFEVVDHIEYDFGMLPLSVVQAESFAVSLALQDPDDRVPLATFRGGMAGVLHWSGVDVMGDSVIGVSGVQEDASRLFVMALKQILGVPIGTPVPQVADESGRLHRCEKCGRNSPPRRVRCQYCGGGVVAITDAT